MLDTRARPSVRSPRSRRRGLIALTILLAVLLGAIVGGGVLYSWATGASGPRTEIVVVIPPGTSGSDVAAMLQERGVIRSATAFRIIAKLRHQSGDIQAGKYRMTTNMTVGEALSVLKAGPFVESVQVTFPEGLTVKQTAARAKAALPINQKDFVAAANSGTFSLSPYLPQGTPTVEGFLFPQTYDFLKDATAEDVINRQLAEFAKETKNLPWANATKLGLTPYQIVIVASMIEEEVKRDEDRPKVAEVIYNRLKRGMALQIDATVRYALGKTDPGLTFKDLEVDSPYNTYLHQGLPPTPIASPSLASITAALVPAEGKLLYYATVDCAGTTKFTASYQEFLTLKAQIPASC